MKIYSFLPSATEIVYSLGLGDQLCGVTHECDYPPEAKMKPVVVQPLIEASKLTQREVDERVVESMTHGHGLYKINREILQRNKPDIVITQELCDVCSVSLKDVLKTVHELSKECRVVSLTPKGLDGVLEDVITVGRACGVEERAMRMVDAFRRRIETVQERA
ncbi:MAG: ABC transporter substrate-binding protein, partial [Thaumarchaeota archaeon]|nr:ABC transporter substrate-binding protein [Nitrososphaerota archaeon]